MRAAPIVLPALIWFATLGGAPSVSASGDVRAGHEIARTWCAACHVISPTAGGTAVDAAPAFAAIANMTSTTEMALRVFRQTPHDRMPAYQLSRLELDDVVAYLLSLRQR